MTATDGDVGQLVALLRAGGEGCPGSTGPGHPIEAGRLLIETERATLEVVADGRLLLREAVSDDREDAEHDGTG